jgi:S1-C subfamily serine protease
LLFRNLKSQFPAIALLAIAATAAQAQQPGPPPPQAPRGPTAPVATPAPATPHAPAVAPAAAAPASTAPGVAPPQVVTVLHRLNGIKLMRWLNRSGAPVAAVVELNDENASPPDMHMSITAGFTLDDGESIVASLPQAEALVSAVLPPSASEAAEAAALAPSAESVESAELTVVRRDGFQFAVNYVGLDAMTGLSLLRLDGLKLPSVPEAHEETLSVGQRVRLYAPERAGQAQERAPGNLYLRMGEIEGRVATITRLASGRVARLTVRAPNLSPSINGGVAINDAGETVGIVEATSATEARILPARVIRSAAARVLARRASVPRPVLGVRGKAVTSASLFQFTSSGWSQTEAAALMDAGRGLLLTSVVPDTPAALADLRAGDIIVRVNNDEVKNAEDFSFMLSEAGGDSTVLFTVLRGQALAPKPSRPVAPPAPMPAIAPPTLIAMPPMPSMPSPELAPFELPSQLKSLKPFAVPVKLSFSFKLETPPEIAASLSAPTSPRVDPLISRGAETIPLGSTAAQRRGARAGLLVVAVAAASQAGRAGLLEGDVIETINGRLLSYRAQPGPLLTDDAPLSLGIVRNGRKLNLILPVKDAKRK